MLWRLWCGVAFLPLGALAAVAAVADPGPREVGVGALLAGALGLIAVTILARQRDDEPDRGRHLARAASLALGALPALGAAWLVLAPSPVVWLLLGTAGLAVALFFASRRAGSAPGLGWRALHAVTVVAGASLLVLVVSGLFAVFGSETPVPTPNRAAAIYDADASVPTLPRPGCGADAPRVQVLADRGAHPATSGDGTLVWFDAETEDGRRQIHRYDRSTGDVVCWTCEEPGNNVRPALEGHGNSLVFTTDRHATWRHRLNTELHLMRARGPAPTSASRRITFEPGPDDHALFVPGSQAVLWSRGRGGRFEIVSAGMSTGHGGLVMGRVSAYVRGGAAWVAPLAWSPDARSLLVARGNPFGPLEAVRIDPATGEERAVAADAAWGARASFNGDGGSVALASARRAHGLGLLPGFTGFLTGALAARAETTDVLFADTEVRTGETNGELLTPALGEVAGWGAPTGVALDRSGRSFVLGQRRVGDGGVVEERLVQVRLACAS